MGKILAKCLGILAFLAILAFFCLPYFFSTATGKEILIKILSEKTGSSISIEDLSLSWLGPQSAKKIHIQNPREKMGGSCETVVTDASLWSLLRNDVGHLQLTAPYFQTTRAFVPVQTQKEFLKKSAFRSASLVGASPTVEIINLPIKGRIDVQNGKVELKPPGLEPIQFDQIALSIDRRTEEEIAIALNCNTSQQGTSGNIAIKSTGTGLRSPFPSLSLQASVSQLPVLGVDQIVSIFAPHLNGVIYAAVGSKVDMQCSLAAAKGTFDLNLNARSPLMNAQIATKTEGGKVSLKSPAAFSISLTPALLQKLAKFTPSLQTLVLSKPAVIEGMLTQFSCPMPTKAEDLLQCAIEAKMTAQTPVSLQLDGAPLVLNALNFSASSPLMEKELALSLNANLEWQAQAGTLSVDGNLLSPFSNVPRGTLSVSANKLPTDFIGIAANSPIVLSPLLGATVDLKGLIDLNRPTPELRLSWQSQFLNIPSLDFALSNPLTLVSPAKFTFGLSPRAFSESPLKLAAADPIEGTLQMLVIPSDIKNARIEATVNTGQIRFSGDFPLWIAKLQATLQVSTLDEILFTVKGDPLEASLSGAFKPKTSTFVLNKPLAVKYAVDGPSLKAMFAAAPLLAKPTTVELSIDPVSFPLSTAKLKGKLSSSEVVLGTQGQIVTLQNMNIPFQWDNGSKTATLQLSSQVQNPSGSAGSMQGQCTLSNFFLEKGINFSQAAILGSLDLDNLSSRLLDAFYRSASLSSIIGPIFSSKLKFQSTLDKQNIAIKWTSANLNVDSAFLIDPSGLQLQGTTNHLSWVLTPESYKVLDQIITTPKALALKAALQREIYLASSKRKNKTKNSAPPPPAPRQETPTKPQPSPFEISESSTFLISLSKLSLPAVPNPGSRIPHIVFDLSKLQLNATGRNAKLSFFDKTSKETIQLSNIAFSVNKTADKGPLTASFDSGVVTLSGPAAAPESVKNGSISLEGKILQSANSTVFDLNQLSSSLQIKIQQLPSRALDIIARARGRTDSPFSTTFGEMINATMALDLKNLSGPFSINVNTPRARLDVEGNFVNGAILLKNTLHAQLKVTPDLSRLVLKEVNPLNLSYFYSQDPITLEIPAAGFYLPLHPFDASKIVIPKAKIELGRVACRNEGNVNITLGLLKSKQFDKSGELGLWFAPIDLSVKQGVAAIERTEILLADTFDICVWGNFDLVKSYVDMVLGLTAQTLSKAFGIQNLPENYVLTLPMKGPPDNVQINTGKATTKIALLLAWQSQNLTGIGGNAGAIVGGLLGKIATLPDSDAKVPPAKHPFPWEKPGKTKKTSSSHREKKKQFKAKDKPLKQILKVIR